MVARPSTESHSKPTVLLYLIGSLSFLILAAQNSLVEKGSLKYWLFLSPLIIPLLSIHKIIPQIYFKAWPILIMLLFVVLWGFFTPTPQIPLRILVLLLMVSWLQLDDTRLKIKTLTYIYLASILISILLDSSLDDFNQWGLIPGVVSNTLGSIWRVSFLPHVVNTAFFSLFVFIICTKEKKTCLENKGVICLALYFIIFSFVRTALISLMVYLFLRVLYCRIKNGTMLFLWSLLTALIANILVAYSLDILQAIQSWPLVDRILLRGEHNLSAQEMYVQLYRPWQWKEQWTIFTHSPQWMGEGVYDMNALSTGFIDTPNKSDAESLLLGMLARYGLPTLLFYTFLIFKNYKNAMQSDPWACAVFPVIIFTAMNYGTIFHPANALFVLYFLVILGGKKAFI